MVFTWLMEYDVLSVSGLSDRSKGEVIVEGIRCLMSTHRSNVHVL